MSYPEKTYFDESLQASFEDPNYKLILKDLNKKSKDITYTLNVSLLDLVSGDKFLSHLLSKRLSLNESDLIKNPLSERLFLKIISIRLIPLLTIIVGSILVLKTL